MLTRLRQAYLVWPTLAALAALAVLIGLGTWQLQRKQWKEGLLSKIAARVHAQPVPLQRAVSMFRRGEDVEYMHVIARGRFLHDKERYLYAPTPGGQGWHVYAPLETAGQILWVNRGLVLDANKAPASRQAGQVQGETEVRGLVRLPPTRRLFTPENDVQNNLWYWPDLDAMTASAFPSAPHAALPFAIDSDAEPAPPGGLPKGGTTRINLSNRHLEYALTWYGLAATLIGVYLAFAAARLRAASPPR
jgi:surfeit locus 1 family protein